MYLKQAHYIDATWSQLAKAISNWPGVISGGQPCVIGFGGVSIESTGAQPGDTVFVPEEMDKTTFVQAAKDWTQILYPFGLGIAGIKSAVK